MRPNWRDCARGSRRPSVGRADAQRDPDGNDSGGPSRDQAGGEVLGKPCLRFHLWSCAIVVFIATMSGCPRESGEQLAGRWVGDSVVMSGIMTVTTRRGSLLGSSDPVHIGEIAKLEAPEALAGARVRLEDTDGVSLLVSASTSLVLVDLATGGTERVGRPGSGPGEFREIHGAVLVGDTIVVWDGQLRRFTWLVAPEWQAVRTLTVTAPVRYGTSRPVHLRIFGSAVLLAWGGDLVNPGGPPDSVVVAKHSVLTEGPPLDRMAIESVSWADLGSIIGAKEAFGARAILALGTSGVTASGTGVGYCFDLRWWSSGESRRVCRDFQRAPIGRAREIQTQGPTDVTPRMAQVLSAVVQNQQFGEVRNSFDELLIDSDLRVWVRVVDSLHQFHPIYYSHAPQLRPESFRWDVFLSDGQLLGAVRLPSIFTPHLVTRDRILGLLEGEDGELSLAVAIVPF